MSTDILTVGVAEHAEHTDDSTLQESSLCEHKVWISGPAMARTQLVASVTPNANLVFCCFDCLEEIMEELESKL